MILWIFLFIATVSTIILGIALCCDLDITSIFVGVVTLISWAVSIIMIFSAISANVNVEGKLCEKRTRRDVIVYQLENGLYDNDNDIGMRNLYEQAREYNEDVAYGKSAAHNKMISIFYPAEVYDNLDLIEFKVERSQRNTGENGGTSYGKDS